MRPGLLEPGTFTARAGYAQASTGTLYIELGESRHDVLAVAGEAALAGTLAIEVLPGYVPMAGQSYTIVKADVVSGAFDTLAPQEGLEVGVRYEAGGVVLTVVDYEVP